MRPWHYHADPAVLPLRDPRLSLLRPDGGHGLRVVREVEIVTTDGRGRFLKIVIA